MLAWYLGMTSLSKWRYFSGISTRVPSLCFRVLKDTFTAGVARVAAPAPAPAPAPGAEDLDAAASNKRELFAGGGDGWDAEAEVEEEEGEAVPEELGELLPVPAPAPAPAPGPAAAALPVACCGGWWMVRLLEELSSSISSQTVCEKRKNQKTENQNKIINCGGKRKLKKNGEESGWENANEGVKC